jgi:hypothetical protein
MPLLVKCFSWWLLPDPIAVAKTNTLGILIVVAILLIQIAAFWLV